MKSFLNGYHRFLRWSIAALMGLMIIPVFLQVLSRFLGIIPRYIWTEDLQVAILKAGREAGRFGRGGSDGTWQTLEVSSSQLAAAQSGRSI